VRHTTKQVVQGQIISRVKKGKVVDEVGGTKEAVKVMIYKLNLCRKYRQVRMVIVEDEVVANQGVAVMAGMDSLDKQKFTSSTRRDPGVYHAVYTAGSVEEHIVSHAMSTELFLSTSC
jgi:hypothetical protein